MTGDGPHTGPRHEPERIHERAADPTADSDPDRSQDEQGVADRASGTTGSGQEAER